MVASSNKRLKKITKLSEISLKDFTDKAQNEVLNWFSMTPAHWVMLHRVMISFFKGETVTKNQLIRFVEKSYMTSNAYIDAAVKKNYFKTIRNTNDKRSIFILPTELTVREFEKYVAKRAWLYKDINLK